MKNKTEVQEVAGPKERTYEEEKEPTRASDGTSRRKDGGRDPVEQDWEPQNTRRQTGSVQVRKDDGRSPEMAANPRKRLDRYETHEN